MAKIQSAGDGHYLYLQTQFGEDRCTQFRVIVVTDPQTHTQTNAARPPQTDRQDRLQYTARSVIIIGSQHAMHAERDIVLCLSVCPSNAGSVSKQMHISSYFLTAGRGIILLFERYRIPSAGALNTRGVGK